MTAHQKTDAIVIGAGHNGLVTAAYLARSGLSVTVLEATDRIGGAAVTREFAPGFKVSGVAHLLHSLHPQIMRDLSLERFGLDLKQTPVGTSSLLDRGQRLDLPAEIGLAAAALNKYSQKDAVAYPMAMMRLRRLADALAGFAMMTPPRPAIAENDWGSKLALGMFAFSLRRLGKKDMLELTRVLTMNAADLATDYFESEALRGLIAFDSVLGLALGPKSPSTAFNLLYRLSAQGRNGLGHAILPRGGMGSVTKALAGAAEAAGAKIRIDAPVEHIKVVGDRAVGVVLKSGEEILADHVVSNADPQRTMLQLVGSRHLDAQFVGRIRHLRMNGCAAKIHLALDGMPPSWSNVQGRMVVSPAINYAERAYDCAKYGKVSDRPILEVTVPSLNDPSLAPAGKHVASIVAQYCPYKLKGLTPDEARDQIARNSLAVLTELAPDLAGKITATEVLTPHDLEQQYGMSGGQWHHGEITLDQVLMLRPVGQYQQYQMPIPGLWLCGSGAHPGGNVSGAPGANAAREILKSMKQKRAA